VHVVPPNGPYLRPHADVSARGRAALDRMRSSAARDRALYGSRRAACSCNATDLEPLLFDHVHVRPNVSYVVAILM